MILFINELKNVPGNTVNETALWIPRLTDLKRSVRNETELPTAANSYSRNCIWGLSKETVGASSLCLSHNQSK